MMKRFGVVALAMFALAGCDGTSLRAVHIVGSSTVLPFTKAVAAAFVAADDNRRTPTIESTGTGGGMVRFCEGVGAKYPDLIEASRRMRAREFDICQANGVKDIIEVPIGLDGIALAEPLEGPKLALTRKDIYLALAANPMGKPNSAKTWKDVNPALPASPITVLGPPATSGTRDAFVELILEPGCLAAMPAAQELRMNPDPALYAAACKTLRSDGAYVEKGEDDEVIVAGLAENRAAIGVLGFSYLDRNRSRLRGVSIDGVAPTAQDIAKGSYAGGRTLYLYVKKRHLDAMPELRAFLDLYASMWGPGGPLTERGLIAAPDKVRQRAAATIANGYTIDRNALP
uniref:substrate-binding domain-containing protein n=1 Tax=Sphingomonas sp. BE123 TaxID=2817842 RepID=UPI00286B6E70|nr:substrate-binding domain-containing protein [Sphingomonas sp. BE123]